MRGTALQPSCGQAAARLYSRSRPPSLAADDLVIEFGIDDTRLDGPGGITGL